MLIETIKKLGYRFRKDGLLKILQLVCKNIKYFLNKFGRVNAEKTNEINEFDEQFGTDTSGIIELSELDITKEKRMHGVRYEATYTSLAQKVLQDLNIQYDNYTFVDIGAGKGRILLLASDYPYNHVIGIELSHDLAEIARKNSEIYSKTDRNCCEIEVLCMDARQYEIPSGNVVLYLYNPFGPPILQVFLSHLRESLLNHPRNILIIYVNPMHIEVFESMDFLTPIKQERQYAIFRGDPYSKN